MIGKRGRQASAHPSQAPPPASARSGGAGPSLWALAAALLVGFGLLGVYAIANPTSFASILAAGGITAAATLAVGSLLGFLFGIPRALQGHAPSEAENSRDDDEARSTRYGPNANLEQISDWLTKILVGVGLTQLTTLSDRLRDLATYLAPGFGATDVGERLAIALVIYFSVCGFIFGYPWTRLFLGGASLRPI